MKRMIASAALVLAFAASSAKADDCVDVKVSVAPQTAEPPVCANGRCPFALLQKAQEAAKAAIALPLQVAGAVANKCACVANKCACAAKQAKCTVQVRSSYRYAVRQERRHVRRGR